MQILPTLSNFRPAPSLSDAATLKQRLTDTVEDIVNFVPQMQSLVAAQNILSEEISSAALTVDDAASSAAASALNAQASANFKGTWASSRVINGVTVNGYSLGESVLGSDNVYYVCLVTHTSAQNPTTTTGYWKVNVPLGAIGNLRTPLTSFILKNKLPSDITVSRVSPIKVIDRYGNMKSIAANSPAFVKGGILCEPLATNLLLYSNQFNSGGGWVVSNSISAQTITGPDGVPNSAWYLDETTVVAQSYTYKAAFSLTAATVYTASLFVKKAEDTEVYFWFANSFFTSNLPRIVRYNFDTKILSDSNNNILGKKVVELADGWVRLSMTFLADITTTGSAMVIGPGVETNTTGSGVYIYGAQLEVGYVATSYIDTTSAQVTRTLHSTSFQTEGLIPSLKDEWSVLIDCTINDNVDNVYRYILGAYTSSYEYFGIAVLNGSLVLRLMINSIPYVIQAGLTYGIKQRVAFTFKNGMAKGYSNGILVDTSVWGGLARNPILPAATQIGSLTPTNSHCNALIERIEFFDKELTPTENAYA